MRLRKLLEEIISERSRVITKLGDMMEAGKLIEEITGEKFHFGVALRGYRTMCDLTQKQLADKLETTTNRINGLEHGQHLISIKKASEYAKLLEEDKSLWVAIAIQDQLQKAGIDTECVSVSSSHLTFKMLEEK